MKIRSLLKKRNISVGVKATTAYFLANMINKAIAYITTPLYTNILSSEEYGQVSVFISWLSLIGIVAMFSLQAGVYNNGMIEFKDEKAQFSFSLLILSNIITLIVSVVLLCTYPYTKEILQIDIPLLILMVVIFFFQPAYNFWITRQRFEYKYKATTLVMVIMNILSPIFALIFIKTDLFGNKVYDRLFGAELLMLAFYLVFYIRNIVDARGRLYTKYWKFALAFNLPLIPHYLSQYMMNSSDKIMISRLIGDSEAAYYSVAYSVAAVISIVWTSINASLIPYTYQNCKNKTYHNISRVVTPLWVLFAFICFALMVFAPELMRFLAPSEYSIGKYVIPPVIGGVFFQSLYYTFSSVNYYYKKTKYVMYASLSAAVINILLNYLLIPRFGFIAAGYTTLLSYMIQAAIDYFAMKTVVSERIYDLRIIITLSLLVSGTACLFPLLYESTLTRYAVLLIICIAGFIFRNSIWRIIRTALMDIRKKN